MERKQPDHLGSLRQRMQYVLAAHLKLEAQRPDLERDSALHNLGVGIHDLNTIVECIPDYEFAPPYRRQARRVG